MGNQQVRASLKSYYTSNLLKDTNKYLQNSFNFEGLQLAEFFEAFWQESAVEHLDKTNIPAQTKSQSEIEAEKDKFFMKSKYLIPTTSSVSFNTQKQSDLKLKLTNPKTELFAKNQLKKMNILLIAYVKKLLSSVAEGDTITYIDRYFHNEVKSNMDYICLNIFLKLLNNLSSTSSSIKSSNLDFLLNHIKLLRPASFFGITKENISIDKAFDSIIDYLKNIVTDPSNDLTERIKSIKVMLNMALAKGSLKNLIDVIMCLEQSGLKPDVNYEINVFKNELMQSSLSLSYPDNINQKNKTSIWNYTLPTTTNENKSSSSTNPFASSISPSSNSKTDISFSLAVDSSYIYLYISNGTLLKIGNGYNDTMLGKVYHTRTNFHPNERVSIAVIDEFLYVRTPNIETPVLALNVEDLTDSPTSIDIDDREINHLWNEGKRCEFELPIEARATMRELIEKKKNSNNEDKAAIRVGGESPITSDGRFLYVVSKWMEEGNEEENEEETNENENSNEEKKEDDKKNKIVVYGVDIYDPMNNMSHVKSVMLNTNIKEIPLVDYDDKDVITIKKESSIIDDSKSFYLPSTFLSKQPQLYTNGTILIINGYKFSLTTGDLIEKNSKLLSSSSSTISYVYDRSNNLIWKITKQENNILSLTSFFNKSTSPLASNQSESMSTESIISETESNIALAMLPSDEATYHRMMTLNLLNIGDDAMKTENIQSKAALDDKMYRKNVQCLLLAIIAKMTSIYGNDVDLDNAKTDIEKGEMYAKLLRRPFCVMVDREVFEKLSQLIDKYSSVFFSNINKDIEDSDNILDAYCLLSVVKILGINMKNLSLSHIDVNMMITQSSSSPFATMKKFIIKTIETYTSKFSSLKSSSKFSLILQSLYDECKMILKLSANILYDNTLDLISMLEKHISMFDTNATSKDIAKGLMTYMSSDDNMRNILKKMNGDSVDRLLKIFDIAMQWEVKQVEETLKRSSNEKIVMKENEDELIAFKFNSKLQEELIKKISKKMLDDRKDNMISISSDNKIIEKLTKNIFSNYSTVIKYINMYIDNVNASDNTIAENNNNDDECIITTSISTTKKETKSDNSDKENKNDLKHIYDILIDDFLCKKLYITKLFLFQINTISILSSDFAMSSILSPLFPSLLSSLSGLYERFGASARSAEAIMIANVDYIETVIESEHPFPNNVNKAYEINLPKPLNEQDNDEDILLEFDKQSDLGDAGGAQGNGYLSFFNDNKRSKYTFQKQTQITSIFPKEILKVKRNKLPIYLYAYTTTVNTTGAYGFKLIVHNNKDKFQKVFVEDEFFKMYQTAAWVASKASAILIKGDIGSVDKKITDIVSEPLFKGGYKYQKIEKEIGNITDVLNVDIVVNNEKNEIDDTKFENFVQKLQNIYAKTNHGGNVGGDKAMKVVSSAFKCMIYHCDYVNTVKKIIDVEDLTKENDYAMIYKLYTTASQMRSWLIEKKKNVDDLLEKQKIESGSDAQIDIDTKSQQIIQKIIDQTLIKCSFLLNLNPSPSTDSISLSKSIISFLQSPISSKKFFSYAKQSSLRAIARISGLNSLSLVFTSIANGALLQDVLTWFTSSMRETSVSLSHCLDSIVLCDCKCESMVIDAFHNFLSIIIKKYCDNTSEEELMTFLDAILWKYNDRDFDFINQERIFDILWGSESETIKTKWGNSSRSLLSNQILEIFEIISNVIIHTIVTTNDSTITTKRIVNNMNIVIFGEIEKAMCNYYQRRGVSFLLYDQFEKNKLEKTNDKKDVVVVAQPQQRRHRRYSDESYNSYEDDEDYQEDYEEGEDVYVEKPVEVEKKEEATNSEEKKFYHYKDDIVDTYDELVYATSSTQGNKKITITESELNKIIERQESKIYNNDYLNRILILLYKLSQQKTECIVDSISTAENITSLLRLSLFASTENKYIIYKSLANIVTHIDNDTVNDIVDIFNADQQTEHKTFIEILLSMLIDVKKSCYNSALTVSSSSFCISTELYQIIRNFILSHDIINEIDFLLSAPSKCNDAISAMLYKEAAIEIFGGVYEGMSIGSRVKVRLNRSKQSESDVLSVEDTTSSYREGTILCFSTDFEAYFTVEKKKKVATVSNVNRRYNSSVNAKKEEKCIKKEAIYLTPNNMNDNKVAVLIDDNTNVNDITDNEPKIYEQYEVLPIQKENSINMIAEKVIDTVLDWYSEIKENKNSSLNSNLLTDITRFILKISYNVESSEILLKNEKGKKIIKEIATLAATTVAESEDSPYMEILEEKRNRLLSFCSENVSSLNDIDPISIKFISSNVLELKVIKDNSNIMNICINVTRAINGDAAMAFAANKHLAFDIAKNASKYQNKIILCDEAAIINEIIKSSTNIAIITNKDFSIQSNIKHKSISVFIIDKKSYDDIINIKQGSVDVFENLIDNASNGKEKLINELVNDFGFNKDFVDKNLPSVFANNNNCIDDINTIISSLLDIANNVQNTIAVDDDNDIEPVNNCFSVKEEDAKIEVPSYYRSMFVDITDNTDLLQSRFIKINKSLRIMHSRHILLNLLKLCLKQSAQFDIDCVLKEVDTDEIISILKLIVNEGLHKNYFGLGNVLVVCVTEILSLMMKSGKGKAKEIINAIYRKTNEEIDNVVTGEAITYEVIKDDEAMMKSPFIFFDVLLMMISNKETAKENCEEYYDMINKLCGLTMKIKNNKEMRWFVIDLMIMMEHNILNDVNKFTKEFTALPNVSKILQVLVESISTEGKKYLSKKTQMICEFVILLYEIDKKIKANSNNATVINKIGKNEIFIKEHLSTYSIMKNFFETNYLKYLSWIETNPEISSKFSQTFESSHLYSKSPTTYLISFPNASHINIDINEDTYFDDGDSLSFSYDPSNKNQMYNYIRESNTKSFTLKSDYAYVTFPAKSLRSYYAMGTNMGSRFGPTPGDITQPKLMSSLSNINVKDIALTDNCTIVLSKDGEIYTCGSGSISGLKSPSTVFTKDNLINNGKAMANEMITSFAAKGTSLMVATQGKCLFTLGSNNSGQLAQQYQNSINDITKVNSFNKEVKLISIADNHTMILTKGNMVYHCGKNDYYQNGDNYTGRNNIPKLINLDKQYTCVSLCTGCDYTLFLMKNKKDGKVYLFSSGNAEKGRTGQGKDNKNTFKLIDSNSIRNVEFKSISANKYSSAAISTEGKLFVWGGNSSGQLGIGNTSDVYEPQLCSFFEKDYEVEDIQFGTDFAIVLAKEKKSGMMCVFGMGDSSNGKLGEMMTSKDKEITTPMRIKFFDNKNPSKVYVGQKGVIVMCDLEKSLGNVRAHKVNCKKCNQNIIGELLCDYERKEFICEQCEDKSKNYIIVTSPMKNINLLLETLEKNETIQTENINEIKCTQCNNVISSLSYAYLQNSKRNFLCEKCYKNFPSCITNVKLFYKSNIKDKTITEKSINILNETNYYDSSVGYGYKITVTPIFNEIGCEDIIKKNQDSFNSFCDDLNMFNKPEPYEQFVDLLNEIAQKANKSIFTMTVKDLVFKKEQLSVRTAINKCSNDCLQKMFIVLKVFNEKVKDLLPYIDFSKALHNKMRLSAYYNKITPLIFWDSKYEIIKSNLEKTSVNTETFELKINRLKVKKFIEKGVPDHLGEHTIYGQIFQHLKQYPFKIFRKKEGGNSCKIFYVQFQGEASIDAGGPYRECLSQAIGELQSPALPLFMQSPNQKNEAGSFREKWIVNPSSTSLTHLQMYEMLGGLIGYAMRTGEFLNMDLPSLFWKSLLEVPLERKDLEKVDKYTIQCLDDIAHCTQEAFESYSDQKFTTIISNGNEVEICPNGRNINLTYDNRMLYCELAEKARLNEGKVQMDAIRSGLEKVIPVGLLKLLSWNELEMLVCGKPILDIELLKENTKYRGCSENDQIIQFFWKCLEEFTAEERSMYLRFVWGRSRLPLTSKDFQMQHRVEIMHHAHPDIALPQSHTCFFSLEIPKYSTYEILKEKLKYAITHCQAIDTDGNANEVWDDEE